MKLQPLRFETVLLQNGFQKTGLQFFVHNISISYDLYK